MQGAVHFDFLASHEEELHRTINDPEVELQDAVQQAKGSERHHYHDIVETERNKVAIDTFKIDAQQLIVHLFTKNMTLFRRHDRELEHQVHRSTKRSRDLESLFHSTKKLLSTAMTQKKGFVDVNS